MGPAERCGGSRRGCVAWNSGARAQSLEREQAGAEGGGRAALRAGLRGRGVLDPAKRPLRKVLPPHPPQMCLSPQEGPQVIC